MLPTIPVYADFSIQSYLYFLGKSHFGNIYIYRRLIVYVALTKVYSHIGLFVQRSIRTKVLRKSLTLKPAQAVIQSLKSLGLFKYRGPEED